MKIAIITINKDGEDLAKKLKAGFPDAKIFSGELTREGALRNIVQKIFNEYNGLIFIAALGIVARVISPCIKSKFSDPAVVAVDTAGRFAISVLSGHEGGANKLAFLTAGYLGAQATITTGKETHKKFILGIGTRRGITADKVKKSIKQAIKNKAVKLEAIRLAATIDLKKNEAGLIKACQELDLPLVFIPQETIRNFSGNISKSEVVRRHIGLDGVCEPCALLAGRRTKLILRKTAQDGVTIALAEEN